VEAELDLIKKSFMKLGRETAPPVVQEEGTKSPKAATDKKEDSP
jgi:hypothetical protein